ncbi:MAG: adenine nucleotide alpha hydrolase family protein, partial [Anaerolineaceae bacterium]|nr:adenine nucleotide alpha hydrolase family protein [Anaerolineaceae bacterium]
DGFYIDLGIDGGFGYSSQSKALTQSFAESRGLNLIIHEVAKEYGESIPEITARSRRGKDKPCAVCGLVKRHVMNEITLKGNYDIVATGHNLDDEAAALFSNTLHWNTGLLARQAPVLESAHGFPGKVKPFCRFYERETAAYTILRGIDYIYDECPFSDGSTSLYYKTILNQMEERSIGAKLHFYTHFLKAKEENFFNKPPLSEEDSAIHPCVVCGQPTHRKDRCAFCQLFVSQD